MPRASVSTVTIAKLGDFFNWRMAKRTSFSIAYSEGDNNCLALPNHDPQHKESTVPEYTPCAYGDECVVINLWSRTVSGGSLSPLCLHHNGNRDTQCIRVIEQE